MTRTRLLLIGALVAALGVGGFAFVNRGDDAEELPPWVSCTSAAVGEARYVPAGPRPAVRLEAVETHDDPTDVAVRAGDDGWYVATRAGKVYRAGGIGPAATGTRHG